MSADPAKPSALAISAANVPALLPKLEFQQSNYSLWRELFLVALSKFNLKNHVDGTPRDKADADWAQNDCTVLTWLYASVSQEIIAIILVPGSTAQAIWTSIENLFRDNKERRAIQLEAEFFNLRQGSMSITEYSTRIKSLADALGDVDEKISDRTLVLTLLRGVNENFAVYKSIVPMQPGPEMGLGPVGQRPEAQKK